MKHILEGTLTQPPVDPFIIVQSELPWYRHFHPFRLQDIYDITNKAVSVMQGITGMDCVERTSNHPHDPCSSRVQFLRGTYPKTIHWTGGRCGEIVDGPILFTHHGYASLERLVLSPQDIPPLKWGLPWPAWDAFITLETPDHHYLVISATPTKAEINMWPRCSIERTIPALDVTMWNHARESLCDIMASYTSNTTWWDENTERMRPWHA